VQIPRRMCAYGLIEGSVKDLRVRSQAAVVLLALSTIMLGCGGLNANNRVQASALVVSNLNLDFGTVVVGNSKVVSENILNTTSSSVTISQVVVTGSSFQLDGGPFPLTLQSNQSATIAIRFVPQNSGKPSGSLAISSTASAPISVALAGKSVNAGQLSVNPSPISFGKVMLGGSQTRSATLTNSGGSDLTISQVAVSGNEFQVDGMNLPFTLPASQSTNFNVTFTPKTSGNQSGTISVTTSASPTASDSHTSSSSYAIANVSFQTNSASSASKHSGDPHHQTVTIPLTGAGDMPGQLTLTPSILSFGNVQMGNSQTLPETLTNSGNSSVNVSQATVTGAGFSVSSLSLPLTLAAGQSQSFSVTFVPNAAGSAGGSLSIVSDASNPALNGTLSGTGVAASLLTASPSSLGFGNIPVGSSQTRSQTLTNSGTSILTISQATVTGSGYSVSGMNLPVILAAGHSTAFNVTFTPSTVGPAGGNLSITSNASNPNMAIPLSGNGAPPGSLTASVSSLSFSSVQVGNSQTLSETLTNSGGSSVTISNAAVIGAAYSTNGLSLPVTLGAGQNTTFSVTFTPTRGGSAAGNLSITSNASNPTLAVPLSGTGLAPGSLTATATSLSFGNLQVGNSQTLSETLTNSGGSIVTITAATIPAPYNMSGMSLPTTLAAGQSTTFTVTFTPTTGGSASGTLSISSNASNPTLAVPLAGTGVTPGSLTATATSLSFGNVQVGNSQTLSETLTNSGGSSVTITAATIPAPYSMTGMTLPTTLTPGQSASFSVKFTPTAGGSASGNLSITSNASNPTLAVPLAGTGVTPGSLTANATSLSFGSVQVGNSQTLSETLTNTGASSVTITAATTAVSYSISGMNLPATLAAGQTTSFNVTFTPTTGGSANGSLSITSNASNPSLSIPLSGIGVSPGSLSATASSLSFGSVQVGNSQTLSETLTNSGGSSLTVTQANVTGTGFSVTGLTLPLTLIPGQSFTFGAVFTPTSAGSASGNIAVVSNASNPNLAISMSGSGAVAGQVTISPGTLSFGSVVVGQSKRMTATLNATGSTVIVSSAATGTSEFALSGQSFPLSIAAGSSATITVTFTPQASGAASDSASFTSNAANSPVEALTGNGTPPPQHSVDLTWNASTSSATGYNIYRGGSSGGPYSQINSTLDSATSYIDSTVVAGNTYFYVTTAVDGNGVESVNSNQVKTVIPTP